MAKEGKLTVVTVLHQPRYEIYKEFDEVLLLGKGGTTVYLGPALDAQAYFESLGFRLPKHMNPADFLMDCISGEVEPDRPLVSSLSEIWSRNQAPNGRASRAGKGALAPQSLKTAAVDGGGGGGGGSLLQMNVMRGHIRSVSNYAELNGISESIVDRPRDTSSDAAGSVDTMVVHAGDNTTSPLTSCLTSLPAGS